MEQAEVHHGKLAMKGASEVMKDISGKGSKYDVVNIDQDIGKVSTMTVHKERGVVGEGSKTDIPKVVNEMLVPHMWYLLKSVEILLEATNIFGTILVNETGELLTVDSLIKSAMAEGVFDVKLMNRPRKRGGDAKNNTYGGGFNNRTEGLIKVDAGLLGITANDPIDFVTSK